MTRFNLSSDQIQSIIRGSTSITLLLSELQNLKVNIWMVFPITPESQRPKSGESIIHIWLPAVWDQNMTCALKCFCLVVLCFIPIFSLHFDFIIWTYCMSRWFCGMLPPAGHKRNSAFPLPPHNDPVSPGFRTWLPRKQV